LMVRSSFSSCAAFWLACAVVCLGSATFGLDRAVAQVPNAEQLQIFQNLPPEQQQAILDSMNRSGSAGPTDRPRTDRALKFPDTIRPHISHDGEQEDADEASGIPREPHLKGN